jgi:hypothetical protein
MHIMSACWVGQGNGRLRLVLRLHLHGRRCCQPSDPQLVGGMQ